METINLPVPPAGALIGDEVDVAIHFRKDQLAEFRDYVDALDREWVPEIEFTCDSTDIRASFKIGYATVTVYGPRIIEQATPPEDPMVLLRAQLAAKES